MATTRYRHVGYGERVGNSFKGIIGGIIAVGAAIILLWWNEGNSVAEIKKVAEGRKNTVSIESSSVLGENEGKLVHMSGMATTSDTLVLADYGFKANALKFRQVVEMYQYKENKKTEKVNSGDYIDTYTYEEVWSTQLINSDKFVESWRDNPKEFNHESEEVFASKATLDAFELSESLVSKMPGYQSYGVSPEIYNDSIEDGKISKGIIYYGYDSKYPEIGDERVYFEVVYPQNVSVIAKQNGDRLTTYMTKVDKPIEMIVAGTQSAEEMFVAEEKKNTFMRWALRFLGFFIMWGGFAAMLKPISVLGGGLPLIGNVLEEGASVLIGIVAVLVAFSITFFVIALAWVFYRPVLGIVLLCVGIGSLFITKKFAEPPAVKERPGME